ncbi:MAG: DUF2062 domain-containing protein [Terracidiphilus sp.]|jgi:uncharacterized protein (DUF2062 family)
MMMRRRLKFDGLPESIRRSAAGWLRQGISPSRLALTLALGFAIGCFPVVGIPTALCAVLAIVLRLNLPAIQAANYVAMPLQLVLIVPFVRLGGWLISAGPVQTGAHMSSSLLQMTLQMVTLAAQALIAWLVIATPAVLLMTVTLTVLLRRVPSLAAAEAGD